MLELVLQVFFALCIAAMAQVSLVGLHFVSVHNGAPGFFTFVVAIVVMRLASRPSPSSKEDAKSHESDHNRDA